MTRIETRSRIKKLKCLLALLIMSTACEQSRTQRASDRAAYIGCSPSCYMTLWAKVPFCRIFGRPASQALTSCELDSHGLVGVLRSIKHSSDILHMSYKDFRLYRCRVRWMPPVLGSHETYKGNGEWSVLNRPFGSPDWQ